MVPFQLGLGTTLLITVCGMMDYRDFAETEMPVPLPRFNDPGIRPPSFFYAYGQFWPPYNLSVDVLEPFPGCDARYAAPCGIQHAIRMVTRARELVCPALGGSPADRQAALDSMSANAFVPEGTMNFGLFAIQANGTIIADPLRPDLVGQRFDGHRAAGLVAQPTLLEYIDWVVRWDGGFVPHFSLRLEADQTAPVAAIAYFEPCPSGERLGVALGRKAIPAIENCNANANNFCAIQNINRLVGMNLVDYLSANSYETITDQEHRISYTTDYSVGAFYSVRYMMNWWGVPGPDRWRNPGMLPDTQGTIFATGGGLHNALNGANLSSTLTGDMEGVNRGDFVQGIASKAAWSGGAWRDYIWNTPSLGEHYKVTLLFGMTWNGTGTFVATGTVHAPERPALAPRCQECSANSSLPCAAVNCKRLAAHTQLEFLKPSGAWSTITSSGWFGAYTTDPNDTYAATWPRGFYVFAFQYNGTCVADGSQPSNIGMNASEFFGGSEVDAKFKLVADNGGGWVSYTTTDGTPRQAYTIKLAKAAKFYYLGVAYTRRSAAWAHDCTAEYAEPCSEHNAQVLVGLANSDITSATSLVDFLAVLRRISEATGDYAPSLVQDFSVHVYNDAWGCLAEAKAAGIRCPPGVLPDALADLQAAALDEAGAWTAGERGVLRTSTSATQQRAFIFGTGFQVPGHALQRLYLVAVVSAAPPPPRCSTGPCPANADCNSQGRCHCRFGFRAEFTLNSSACEELKPALMQCADARGLDCSNAAATTACAPCPAGFYCPEGLPQACPQGSYCPEGVSEPVLCESGTFSTRTYQRVADACEHCPPGMFAGKSGQTTCEACPAGKASNSTGQSRCDSCGVGMFQPYEGNGSCLACENIIAGSTTALLGATGAEECICREGTFLPVAGDRCEPCPGGMTCCLGSSLSNLFGTTDVHLGNCPRFPQLNPRFWSSATDPLVVFECHSENRCPGGKPGTCGANLIGSSCAHCTDGFYWDGENCRECAIAEKSVAFFPVIPLAISFLLPGILYKRMNDPYPQWGSWFNTIAALFFVMLNHYQTIDILGETKVPVTQALARTYDVWSITNNFLSIFKTSCIGMTATRDIMLFKALAPVILGVAICILIAGSQFLARVTGISRIRMELSRSFNVYFSILFTLFGAMTAMSLELFKCKTNPSPNTALSLVVDPSVICFTSDQWTSMLAVAVFSVAVYVVGVGLVLMRAVLLARTQFHCPTFRQRWSFLFIKYRLGTWWWGLAWLYKNFMVNFSLVIFSSPLLQFLMIQTVVMLYLVCVQMLYPYRSIWANRIEVLASLSIVFNTTIMTAFTFFEESTAQRETMGNLGVAVTFFPIALGSAYAMYLAFYGLQAKFGFSLGLAHEARKATGVEKDARHIVDSFLRLATASEAGCVKFLLQLGEYERMRFHEVDGIICSELGTGFKLERRPSQISTGELKCSGLGEAADDASGEATNHVSSWRKKLDYV